MAPDRIERRFRANQPNHAWVGDMTFIRTRAGWLYLAVLLDLYSRRIVGWSMGDRPNEALTLGALNMAIEHRDPQPGLIHHTDQGGIYRSRGYRERMDHVGMLPSMGAKGTAYDNAVAESFFSNLKNELVHHVDFLNRESARAAIFSYIELFYNRQRIHQTLGYVSPVAFEQASNEVLNKLSGKGGLAQSVPCCPAACIFVVKELTTLDYSNAAPSCYQGVWTIPWTGL